VKLDQTAAAAAALAIIGGVALFVNSCATGPSAIVQPLEIAGAHHVGNRVCAECHAHLTREFAASPHARIAITDAAMQGETGCESCHGPGSRHVETGGQSQYIINPGNNPVACFRCHLEVQAEFELPAHHPVIEEHMNCVQCHDPHGGDIFKPAGGLAMSQPNETCAQCHREQTRPFVFEHPAMREGCTVCHNPHGSVNRMLLIQADANLCLRCHAQVQGPAVPAGSIYIGKVDHTALLQEGTCWSAGCHTAVHGSNVDPNLLF
jgi:predicted CXXCH cytochrome family protein